MEFADSLQGFLHLAVRVQGLANLGSLIGAEAQLSGFSAGIIHVKDPLGMALSAGALGATAGVMDGALEQGAAEDAAKVGESGGESIPVADGPRTCHLYHGYILRVAPVKTFLNIFTIFCCGARRVTRGEPQTSGVEMLRLSLRKIRWFLYDPARTPTARS
jgi:hypothetical protein